MSFTETLSSIWEMFKEIVRNDHSVNLFIFGTITTIIQMIYAELVKKIPIFIDDAKTNNAGKIVSWSLALITTTGIVFADRRYGFGIIAKNIIGSNGIFLILAIVALLFIALSRIPLSAGPAMLLTGITTMILSTNLLPVKSELISGVFIGATLSIASLIYIWISKK